MFNEEQRLANPIRWAMVGGGRGSEIGHAHRAAAARDQLFTLCAGCFDINPARNRDFAANLQLDSDRCYSDYQQMFDAEAKRKDGIQAVSVATPNGTHFAICSAALTAGLHVICEKPVTFTVSESEQLKKMALQQKKIFAVMYGYSGYQTVHQARAMIARGDIGKVRVVNMSFAHGFHNTAIEEHSPGAKWRMNPEISGPSYVLGDLGTHVFYLASLMTDLKVKQLCCMRQSFIESRAPLEDNAHVMLKYHSGAVGTLWASSVNAGSMHRQIVRVVGEKGSIEWWDERPNQLLLEMQGQPAQTLERGMNYLVNDIEAISCNRIGGGHPEGFFESWANLYHRYAIAMQAMDSANTETLDNLWYPDIDAGIEGVRLLECCVESADNQSTWVNF
ncbi:MAG: Gfo/Idh/MocA family oxidoreductase [Oceanospirillaceae bacterium]|nr:Gfo/Idh/MocA family oxidoreductase [Oceanospirillaceae bacterium]